MQLKIFPDRTEFITLADRSNVIPVCMDILADTETPLSALAKVYANHGPVFLLESVEGGERWGRYSFLGASAHQSIRVYRDRVEVENAGPLRQIPHEGDPLSVLRALMAGYRPVSIPGLPRFWGGMVGYIAYEFVSFFEAIPNAYPEHLPLAHFIIPDRLFIFDNIKHTLTLVAYAFLDGKDPQDAYDEALRAVAEMRALLAQPLSEPPIFPEEPFELTPRVAPDAFRAQVSRIKE